MTSSRSYRYEAFLARCGHEQTRLIPLPGDASFRRYFRLENKGLMLMDAPPATEALSAFIKVAGLLLASRFSAPRIIAADEQTGLALIEDFGDHTFTRVLAAEPFQENDLYTLAMDVIGALQQRCARPPLPAYDSATLLREVALAVEWPIPQDSGVQKAWAEVWRNLLKPVQTPAVPVLVLRDYHVDNMMVLSDRQGVARCGSLDFQDARSGHPAYDVVSLLQDARRDVPIAIENTLFDRWLGGFASDEQPLQRRAYHLLGAQRALKIIGIFHRLHKRDNKPQYIHYLPRVWRMVAKNMEAEPELRVLNEFLPKIQSYNAST